MLVGCRDIAIRSMYAIFCTVYLGKYNVVYSVHCSACRVIEEKFVVSFVSRRLLTLCNRGGICNYSENVTTAHCETSNNKGL